MGDKLNDYNKKRDFRKTKEPQGKSGKRDGKLRFVVHHHAAQNDHFDFRLEWEGVMPSWVIPKGPSFDPGDKRLAIKVEDHPLDYRNFEGTIPEDEYGGGTVMIWDEGTWQPQDDAAAGSGIKEGELKFTLEGERLTGKWVLIKMHGKASNGGKNWLLIKEKDKHAKADADLSGYRTSVRTGRTMKEISEESPKGS